jgi:hypothetical protein
LHPVALFACVTLFDVIVAMQTDDTVIIPAKSNGSYMIAKTAQTYVNFGVVTDSANMRSYFFIVMYPVTNFRT